MNSSSTEAAKRQLENKIWITRKSRINASERLLAMANFIDFVNVYYSIFLILLSLIPTSSDAPESNTILSYVNLACSITLTISIIYATSLGWKERSAALKQNYIALQSLLDRLMLLEEDDKAGIGEINKEYCALLLTVENQKQIDYFRVLLTGNVQGYKLTFWNWCYVAIYYAWYFLWRAVLVIAPIAYILFLFLWVV